MAASVAAGLPPHQTVVGQGECPTAAEVAHELARLLPGVSISIASAAESTEDAVVVEGGDGISVSIAGQEKRFFEPERACSKRAQLAAVFITIVLDPPRLPSESERDAPSQPPGRTRVSGSRLELDVGPTFQVTPGSAEGTIPLGMGAGARAYWGGNLSLAGGVAGMWSTPLHYPRADVRSTWIPFDVGARIMRTAGSWGTGAELSLVLAPVQFRGSGVTHPSSAWRLDVGARVSVLTRVWVTDRVGVVLSVYGLVFPAPYTFGVAGLGEVGQAPMFWMGSHIGVVMATE